MFGDHYAPAKQLLAQLQSVVGATREASELHSAQMKGRWLHDAHYRGRPLRLVIQHNYAHRAVGALSGVLLCVPLGQRPITLAMNFDALLPGQVPRPLPGNEGSLFPHGLVSGTPIEIVRAAFDPPTIATVNASIGKDGLSVTTDADWLCVFLKHDQGHASPDEITRALDLGYGIADRLIAAFDQAHAAVLQTGGPAAAQQWLSGHAMARQQKAAANSRFLAGALAVMFIGLIVVVGVIVAIVKLTGC